MTGAAVSGIRVTVAVPATSANLGAGFDALALALDLTNEVTIEASPSDGVDLEVDGEGRGRLRADPSNRFLAGLERGLAEVGLAPAGGWRIAMRNAIPLGRGLGSSAAATVAGLVTADALSGGRLGKQRILGLASAVEGHPDNAAAALLGGFVVVSDVGGEPRAVRFEPPSDLLAIVFIPTQELATAEMRAVLPDSVPRADAVRNVGRAALAVAAFATGRLELLAPATEDRLHEPYRAAVFPALPRLIAAARRAGALGACLSGAGSTVIAFADTDGLAADVLRAFTETAQSLALAGSAAVLRPRSAGATVSIATL